VIEAGVEGAFVVGKLIGIPSYHFDPIFARVAANALTALSPSVVTLELPDGLLGEMEWAASCWPGPVVSASEKTLFPFVPGDSIFETFRLASAARIPVVLVDLPSAVEAPEPSTRHVRANALQPELSRAGAELFLEANNSLLAPLNRHYVAREAYMAQSLARLLERGETVMWVGGMAHWTRIVGRITSGRLTNAPAEVTVHSHFKRMRLAPSALYQMTHRLPWLVASYGRGSAAYEEHAATQILSLEATKKSSEESFRLVLTKDSNDSLDVMDEPELSAPIDVARTLQYARNQAAVRGLGERPNFFELLSAAVATVGPKYAGNLYELAMNEQAPARALEHDALEWEVVDGRERYRCGDQIISARPWLPPKGGRQDPSLRTRRTLQGSPS
jgi:hypothetical protein